MFSRILVAIDGTDAADIAVSFATAVAREFSSTVRVVHVNEYLVGGRGFLAESEPEARRIVDDAVTSLLESGVTADGQSLRATCFNVGLRIVEAADEWSADVLVLGSRRRRRLRHLTGQGMRERVTAITDLPTLIAPAPLRLSSLKAPSGRAAVPPRRIRASARQR